MTVNKCLLRVEWVSERRREEEGDRDYWSIKRNRWWYLIRQNIHTHTHSRTQQLRLPTNQPCHISYHIISYLPFTCMEWKSMTIWTIEQAIWEIWDWNALILVWYLPCYIHVKSLCYEMKRASSSWCVLPNLVLSKLKLMNWQCHTSHELCV